LLKSKILINNINKTLLFSNKLEKRPFWHWLNHAWNEFDSKRVEEVGPNRACAEWLLKCGATVKFKNWGNFIQDFNKMPGGSFEQYLIEEIRAENSCIMARGFDYFDGLKDVKTIKFINCELIDDVALGKLSCVKNSLENLEIVFCPTVTDIGLSYLYLLRNLKDLFLNCLPNVKDPKLAEKLLKEKLPNCKVEFIEGEIKVSK
jgi:H+-transporting ATP synthase F0 complex subunit s